MTSDTWQIIRLKYTQNSACILLSLSVRNFLFEWSYILSFDYHVLHTETDQRNI